jgi:hypothetical protein
MEANKESEKEAFLQKYDISKLNKTEQMNQDKYQYNAKERKPISYTMEKKKAAEEYAKNKEKNAKRMLFKVKAFYDDYYPESEVHNVYLDPKKKIKIDEKDDLHAILDLCHEEELYLIFDMFDYYSKEKRLGRIDRKKIRILKGLKEETFLKRLQDEVRLEDHLKTILVTPVMEDGYRQYLISLAKKRLPAGELQQKHRYLLREKQSAENQLLLTEKEIEQRRMIHAQRVEQKKKEKEKLKKKTKEVTEDSQNGFPCKCGKVLKSKGGLTNHMKACPQCKDDAN